ncbi:hypothetical protein [Streptomyces sp. NBC_00470]|uniref:hypothetical protein n=1 Tax=Streptomyces sp. NBC_00470 TaxID=2975753 RepID=UPI002F91A0B6
MPLNVPIAMAPSDTTYTVHSERQRWSVDQLAATPNGMAALETSVREGVRAAASACVFAGLTEAHITVTEYPDGSVALVGRVLCDETACHTAALRHYLDAADEIEALAAACWAEGQGLADTAATGPSAESKQGGGWSHQEVLQLGRTLLGVLLGASGWAMSQYDYHRPHGPAVGDLTVAIGQVVDEVCSLLAMPLMVCGALILIHAFVRSATAT